MLLLYSQTLDPFWNLAVEEWILDGHLTELPVLMLWQSHRSVVLGKNQNPWRECDLGALRDNEVQLARRVSGGGAVFHDQGNLNFSLFVSRDSYKRDEPFELVLKALEHLGIFAQRMGSTSIGVAGRKVSGNAFCLRRNVAMHHGTLLIDADLPVLQSCLRRPEWVIDSHAVASEPLPVVNLKTLEPNLTIDQVGMSLATAFSHWAAGEPTVRDVDTVVDPEGLELLASRQRSWEWVYGNTPAFNLQLDDVSAHVAKGIVEALTFGDAKIQLEPGEGVSFMKTHLLEVVPSNQRAAFERIVEDIHF